jgi:hypothetical protein
MFCMPFSPAKKVLTIISVLLGSFSNYLVAKSSVPVMVARKKLKHTKKYSQTNIRLSNNLTSNSARILANAKVD